MVEEEVQVVPLLLELLDVLKVNLENKEYVILEYKHT
jgi:hypothetical protein